MLDSLVIGWPPQVVLKRGARDKEVLHPLFVGLEYRQLLSHGYGPHAGINDLQALSERVDGIRPKLEDALRALRPDAPIAQYLRILSGACDELLGKIYPAMNEKVLPDPSDVAPAVDQLRQAFREVANRVWALYRLPAAGNLASRIAGDIASRPTAGA
jgi:hypothetical protein